MDRGLLKALVILPAWLFGVAMLMLFLGFNAPGFQDYSPTGWRFVNYGVPLLGALAYFPFAWWIVKRERKK